MSRQVFRVVLALAPPSANAGPSSRTRRLLKQHILTRLGPRSGLTVFRDSNKLYGRIWYFNHDRRSPRDIHNIIKPLFNELSGRVYDDDKQIKHFEGFRLDMEHNDSFFEIELDLSADPDLARIYIETVCVVEICELPQSLPSPIAVRWLD